MPEAVDVNGDTARGGSGTSSPSKKKAGKMVACRVLLLDNSQLECVVDVSIFTEFSSIHIPDLKLVLYCKQNIPFCFSYIFLMVLFIL